MEILRYKNKYRIPSARLKHWNYANEALYFVTICTKNRVNYFGTIAGVPPALQPTEIGKIAHLEWYKSPALRPDMNLALGEFIVMPNHIHGMVIIGANKYNTRGTHGMHDTHDMPRRDAMHRVSTDGDGCQNQFAPQSKNLASIMRGYKSAVTTYARKNGIEFDWQPRFHDHIIRTIDEYHRIANYIINNPANWQNDKFYHDDSSAPAITP